MDEKLDPSDRINEPIEGEKLPQDVLEKIENFSLEDVGEKFLPGFLWSKAGILLVLSGAKPASEFTVTGEVRKLAKPIYMVKHDNQESSEIILEKVKKLKEFLESLGLKCMTSKLRMVELTNQEDSVQEVLLLHFSKDETVLNNLLQIDLSDDRINGRMFGYPETAIEAYLGQRERLYMNELPDEVKDHELLPFVRFTLSRDNWREELKTAQAWRDTIKKNSPKLFDEILTNFDSQ